MTWRKVTGITMECCCDVGCLFFTILRNNYTDFLLRCRRMKVNDTGPNGCSAQVTCRKHMINWKWTKLQQNLCFWRHRIFSSLLNWFLNHWKIHEIHLFNCLLSVWFPQILMIKQNLPPWHGISEDTGSVVCPHIVTSSQFLSLPWSTCVASFTLLVHSEAEYIASLSLSLFHVSHL